MLKMVNGVLLLVDAAEGCMPQTRFVLQKALQQNLSLVIAVNKIDRPDARIAEVIDEILELLMDLGASDEQLDSPMVFCSGRNGTASYDWTHPEQGHRLKAAVRYHPQIRRPAGRRPRSADADAGLQRRLQ